jgi:hypothetical protein
MSDPANLPALAADPSTVGRIKSGSTFAIAHAL